MHTAHFSDSGWGWSHTETPLDRYFPEGTWDQAAKQEVTSYWDLPTPVDRMTDTCKNITLHKLHLRAVIRANTLIYSSWNRMKTILFIGGSKGGARDARPLWGSKFFHFHAVFSKKMKNNSNFGSWRTPLGKILDPPLHWYSIDDHELFLSGNSVSFSNWARPVIYNRHDVDTISIM